MKEESINTAVKSLEASQSSTSTASPDQFLKKISLKRVASSINLFQKPNKMLKQTPPKANIPDTNINIKENCEAENRNPNENPNCILLQRSESYTKYMAIGSISGADFFKHPIGRPTKRASKKENSTAAIAEVQPTLKTDQNILSP